MPLSWQRALHRAKFSSSVTLKEANYLILPEYCSPVPCADVQAVTFNFWHLNCILNVHLFTESEVS